MVTMVTQPQLAALAAAMLSIAGVVIGLVGVIGTRRPPRPPSGVGRWVRNVWTGNSRDVLWRRARQTTIVTSVVAGGAIWLVSGWPIAGLIVSLAIPGIPWLFLAGSAEKRAIARLEAFETWTRRLHDMVGPGLGLQQAVVATAVSPPALIQDEVRGLAAELQAGRPAAEALHHFADRLDDYNSDQVIAPLILQTADRSEGLSTVLADVSQSINAEVEMRRTIDAKRAGPRFAVRFLTGMTVFLLAFGALNPAYVAPYGTVLGQLILLGLAIIYVALLIWVRNLSLPADRARLLAPTTGARST
jgi:Flp pilus assembly protein TadB